MKLYHGTSAENLDRILVEGLIPRDKASSGNWGQSVKSRTGNVYLTSAYGLYFASTAAAPGESGAIIEVDIGTIDEKLFRVDEDAVEQTNRGRDSLPCAWSVKRRTIYYRSRSHLYDWRLSLDVLGTMSVAAVIAPSSFTRVLTIHPKAINQLVFGNNLDPFISVQNYQFVGKKYADSMAWMFGDAVHPNGTKFGPRPEGLEVRILTKQKGC